MPFGPLIDISGFSSRPLRNRSSPTRRYLRSICAGRAKVVSSTFLSWFAVFDGASAREGAGSDFSAFDRSPSTIFSALSSGADGRSEGHTYALQSLMRTSYAVFFSQQTKTDK